MDDLRIFSLDLEEFRGIRRIEGHPIKLVKFNFLIGRNNSGKTSLLESLAFLPSPNMNMPFTNATRMEFVKSYHQQQTDALVYGYSGSAQISYSVGSNKSILCLESDGKYHFEIESVADLPTELRSANPRTFKKSERGLIIVNHTPTSLSQVTASYYSDDLNDVIQNSLAQEKNWKTVEKSRAHNRVLKEVISPSVSEKFTEVVPHSLSNRWILQARKEFPDGNSSYVRLSELGRGLQRVIVPLLAFEAANPSVVLWDDIEAGMHPSLMENVLKWLFKKDWQLLISTHSIDVLAAVAELEPRDSQIIILRKSPEDILSYQILDMESFRTIIDSNQDPRKTADLLALR